jgi:hypothetical protein
MRDFLQILLITTALLSAAAVSTAQEPGGAAPEPAAESGAESPDAAAGAEPDMERPPDDYEASEQISEDLSVSFPVDI